MNACSVASLTFVEFNTRFRKLVLAANCIKSDTLLKLISRKISVFSPQSVAIFCSDAFVSCRHPFKFKCVISRKRFTCFIVIVLVILGLVP